MNGYAVVQLYIVCWRGSLGHLEIWVLEYRKFVSEIGYLILVDISNGPAYANLMIFYKQMQI